jgi:hypothetical protein
MSDILPRLYQAIEVGVSEDDIIELLREAADEILNLRQQSRLAQETILGFVRRSAESG